ncbi:GDP-mannose 4,6-dehydratase [Candidatus Uhrbacteria bacterium]|nr:GDP-mannose 4,6-dehydratase [Candidatus Uhrbacteria bacterium]
MFNKRALITGITGQDGAYLAKFLVSKGYKVFGAYRRSSTRNFWRLHYLDVKKDIELLPVDMIDQTSIMQAISSCEPDEIYNLAAQSFVGDSFMEPIATGEISGLGVVRILDTIRLLNPKIKLYQASTSEMYGNSTIVPQNEDTPFQPSSPYAAAKLYAHWVVRNYREAYGLFACSGILFNHESPIRGIEFVTKKITDTAARIKLGLSEKLHLGNLEAKRDWGFAGDYVKAMWLMLQQPTPDDFVIATGESHSVQEFCDVAFGELGLQAKDYVVVDQKFVRPRDVAHLQGDSSKAQRMLGWNQKETPFSELVRMMVRADLEKYQHPDRFMKHFLKHI